MFFILSKIFSWLIMPVSLIAMAFAGALFFKKPLLKKWLTSIGIAAFLFFTNPFLARVAINTWEPPAIKYEEIKEPYEWAIVLAGFTDPNKPPFDRTHFNKGADRLLHAIELYKKGLVKNILISGGSGILSYEGRPESQQLRSFAISMGVPSRHILAEDLSKNTWENAHHSRKILVERNAQGNILLITSAFHMARAKGCFENLGYSLDTFPTDYYGGTYRLTLDELILPGLYGIQIWTVLFKEWAGIVAYKLAGYI